MSIPAPLLTEKQIRRRAIDYDSLIRQGLEEGDIRRVVKDLGSNLVSKKNIILILYTNIWYDLDGVVDPSLKGNCGAAGSLSQAPVPYLIHSGMEP
jgi:hypothetical protein